MFISDTHTHTSLDKYDLHLHVDKPALVDGPSTPSDYLHFNQPWDEKTIDLFVSIL